MNDVIGVLGVVNVIGVVDVIGDIGVVDVIGVISVVDVTQSKRIASESSLGAVGSCRKGSRGYRALGHFPIVKCV